MKKLYAVLGASAIFLNVLAAPLMAGGFGAGVGLLGISAKTEGTETLKSNSTKSMKEAQGEGVAVSGYIQYMTGENKDGFVIGLEKIPGKAELGSTLKTRTDWVTGNTTVADNVEQNISAKIEDHIGLYIESPSLGGIFLRVGISQVDLVTDETLGTGSSYGNETLDGTSIGLGFRGTSEAGLHVKFIAEYTEYDEVTLTSTGSDVASTIVGDIETAGARLSIGYQF